MRLGVCMLLDVVGLLSGLPDPVRGVEATEATEAGVGGMGVEACAANCFSSSSILFNAFCNKSIDLGGSAGPTLPSTPSVPLPRGAFLTGDTFSTDGGAGRFSASLGVCVPVFSTLDNLLLRSLQMAEALYAISPLLTWSWEKLSLQRMVNHYGLFSIARVPFPVAK